MRLKFACFYAFFLFQGEAVDSTTLTRWHRCALRTPLSCMPCIHLVLCVFWVLQGEGIFFLRPKFARLSAFFRLTVNLFMGFIGLNDFKLPKLSKLSKLSHPSILNFAF